MPSDKRVIEYRRDPDAAPDTTGAKQDTRFKPGQSGNPAGRPRGSRNKLGEEFLDDLIDEWRVRGKQALQLCATREPTQFCKIVANILPKEVLSMALNVNTTVDPSEIENAKGFLAAYRYARDRIGAVPLIEIETGEGAADD
jgi:hypothetical protein